MISDDKESKIRAAEDAARRHRIGYEKALKKLESLTDSTDN